MTIYRKKTFSSLKLKAKGGAGSSLKVENRNLNWARGRRRIPLMKWGGGVVCKTKHAHDKHAREANFTRIVSTGGSWERSKA